jgi:kinetochore protein NDC80
MKQLQSELQSKVDSLTQEKNAMEKSMEEITQNIHRLNQSIQNQELTVDDVRKMERHKLRLEEQYAHKKTVLDGHANAVKEAREKYAHCIELLSAAVEEYNSKAVGLELIPATAKNAQGRQWKMVLNDKADTLEGLLGLDVESVVRHVKKVGEGYDRETKEEKRRANELKERIGELEVESEELDQVMEVRLFVLLLQIQPQSNVLTSIVFATTHIFQTINDKITQRQEESTTEQEKLQSEIQAKQRQLHLLQSKITTLNDPSDTNATIATCEKRYKELQALQKKQEGEIVAKKQAVMEEIRKAVQASVDLDKFAEKVFEERNAYAKRRLEERDLTLPAEPK